jgi:hypothetical protein
MKKIIKIYVRESGCEDMDWIHLAQERVQAFENMRETKRENK